MDCQKILNSLKSENFIKINNTGGWFEKGTSIYAKEIKENIFLLFVVLKKLKLAKVQALIAEFENMSSIGKEEPIQIMFYLSIKNREDFHYFEKYIKIED
ncbi:hypothetical protein [Chryseobacterium sp. CT-SW4]|uniref:hypothetical protein n=1 Tax=Chryseobacterium sp. SW-1 TaxID=3157343 RepID=UPI003B023F88